MSYAASYPFSNRAVKTIAARSSPISSFNPRPTSMFFKHFSLRPCFSVPYKWLNPIRSSSVDASSIRCDDAAASTGGRPASPRVSRRWIVADPPCASQDKVTIVSYNILAKRYAAKHSDMYLNVPSRYMDWENRRKVICEELMVWNPDIICLQEVDKYFDILKILEEAGYTGQFKKRAGDLVDGCAVFWKVGRWRLLEGESIDFKDLGLRDNVAQLSVFELEVPLFELLQFFSHRKKCNTSIYRLAYGRKYKLVPCPLLRQMCNDETRRLLVGNIHVVFRPSRGDVKLGQVRFLSSKAHSLSEKWGNVPVVLAGDFNCTPNSPIYKFLSTSKLNVMLHDRRELSGQKNCHPDQVFGIQRPLRNPYSLIECFFKHSWTNTELKNATGDAEMEIAVHPLKLRSTYTMLKGSDSTRDSSCEPLATSYHSKFIGTVDYLWFTDGVVPTKVLDTVPIGALRKIGGLPSKEVGSDHLALVAEFAFT